MGVIDGVKLAVGVGVIVGVAVSVGVWVMVAVSVAVAVGGTAVFKAVSVGVAVGGVVVGAMVDAVVAVAVGVGVDVLRPKGVLVAINTGAEGGFGSSDSPAEATMPSGPSNAETISEITRISSMPLVWGCLLIVCPLFGCQQGMALWRCSHGRDSGVPCNTSVLPDAHC